MLRHTISDVKKSILWKDILDITEEQNLSEESLFILLFKVFRAVNGEKPFLDPYFDKEYSLDNRLADAFEWGVTQEGFIFWSRLGEITDNEIHT